MTRRSTATRPRAKARSAAILALAALGLCAGAAPAEDEPNPTLDLIARQARAVGRRAGAWYRRTPPAERITWGGLLACAALGLGAAAERTLRIRRGRVIPRAFVDRFQSRLSEGRLDRTKALDYIELNPSPAARVALAAVQRWGRPAADLERSVALARGREVDRLRRGVGTLRRVAGLSPLLGLLGTLTWASRALSALGPDAGPTSWGPALAAALAPLTAGVALAILALVAFDGLSGRIEALAGELDRLGAETIDAIVAAAVADPPRPFMRPDAAGAPRAPHPSRAEVPGALSRLLDDDD